MPEAPATSLFSQLETLCAAFGAEAGVTLEVAIVPSHLDFGPELADVVFRTVRELLTNVQEHAQAKHVTVSTAERRDGSIAVAVADDGVGIPPHRRRGNPLLESGGIGLWSIDQRLREFGGALDIEAAPHRGTTAR